MLGRRKKAYQQILRLPLCAASGLQRIHGSLFQLKDHSSSSLLVDFLVSMHNFWASIDFIGRFVVSGDPGLEMQKMAIFQRLSGTFRESSAIAKATNVLTIGYGCLCLFRSYDMNSSTASWFFFLLFCGPVWSGNVVWIWMFSFRYNYIWYVWHLISENFLRFELDIGEVTVIIWNWYIIGEE